MAKKQPRSMTRQRAEAVKMALEAHELAFAPLRRVIKIQGSQPRPYVVDLYGPRGHTCDCPDWLFHRRIEGGNCKHIGEAISKDIQEENLYEHFREDWFSPIGGDR